MPASSRSSSTTSTAGLSSSATGNPEPRHPRQVNATFGLMTRRGQRCGPGCPASVLFCAVFAGWSSPMIWPVAGYEFDVFLSYSRSGNPHMWVRTHFHSLLKSCLEDQLPYEPAIFVDEELDTGVDWPVRLQHA